MCSDSVIGLFGDIPLNSQDPLVENAVAVLVMMSMLSLAYFAVLFIGRGVPIIGSAIISATNMVIFTNIGIGTEQQEDRYRYRYL